MLDIKFIRENVDIVKNAIKVKGVSCDLDALLKLDEKIIANKTEVQGYQEKVNALSKQIPVASDDDKKKMAEESKNYGDKIKALEKEIEPDLKKYNALLMSVPQIPDPSVPFGADDSENVVIKTNGEITKFDFQPRDQMELTELNDWVDFDHIAKVSGARIYALKGELARLEVALHMYVLDKLAKKGFRQISCPSLCKIDALFQAGHFVGDDPSVMDNDVYKIEKDELCLAGTSEIIINALHQGEILNEDDLPVLYAGYSPCFRREAGAAGKDTRGLVRVHQFMKVEEFVICKNDIEESKKWHQVLQNSMEELCADMNIPCHVLEACTGDMGFNKIYMTDVEAWVPSQNKYREVSSTSTIGDFQARRTKLRYRENATGKVQYCHTLNSTGVATPRFLVAFIENNQNADGSVNIPEKLRPYMGGVEKIGGKK